MDNSIDEVGTTTYVYDQRGLLIETTSVQDDDNDGNPEYVFVLSHTYDARGNRVADFEEVDADRNNFV